MPATPRTKLTKPLARALPIIVLHAPLPRILRSQRGGPTQSNYYGPDGGPFISAGDIRAAYVAGLVTFHDKGALAHATDKAHRLHAERSSRSAR